MAKRRTWNPDQMSLFEQPRLGPLPRGESLRDRLVAQIIRDSKVLEEDDVFHVPDRAFYEARIASYREEIARLDAQVAYDAEIPF